MKAVIALIGAGLIIMMLSGIMYAIKDFRSEDVTAPYNVTTDNGTEQATVVLANDVLDDNKVNISVTSSDGDDAPIPFTYTEATRQVTITGLDVSTTRTLTLVYKTSSQLPMIDTVSKYIPLFLILGVIAIVAGVIYSAVQNARNG